MADQGPRSQTVLGGRYRLGDRLGSGGFADVYLVEHLHFKTQRAIKVLTRHLTPEEIARVLGHWQAVHQQCEPARLWLLSPADHGRVLFAHAGHGSAPWQRHRPLSVLSPGRVLQVEAGR